MGIIYHCFQDCNNSPAMYLWVWICEDHKRSGGSSFGRA